MEKKMIRGVMVLLLILTVAVFAVFLKYPGLHVYALNRQRTLESREQTEQSVLELMRYGTEVLTRGSGEDILKKQLRLELPREVSPDEVTITNDYLSCQVEIVIPGINEAYFYDYPMIGRSDHIENITYVAEQDQGIVDMALDGVYELDVLKEGQYLYLDFIDPHQLYEKIIVIDAGHGGADSGASKMGVEEKNIDLAIIKELQELLAKEEASSIGVFYTRLDDSNPSLESRVGLANTLQADLFLSVHNNSTASGRMSSIRGTEVMYRVTDKTGQSKAFAQRCLDSLLFHLGSPSKGLVAGDDIYIIRQAQMPVALVEVGFMTNEEELKLLQDEEYQKKSARALYDAILGMLEVGQ